MRFSPRSRRRQLSTSDHRRLSRRRRFWRKKQPGSKLRIPCGLTARVIALLGQPAIAHGHGHLVRFTFAEGFETGPLVRLTSLQLGEGLSMQAPGFNGFSGE
jgi:hypothetical protein